MGLLCLSLKLVEVDCLSVGGLALLLLDFVHELGDLLLQFFLQALLHLGVL